MMRRNLFALLMIGFVAIPGAVAEDQSIESEGTTAAPGPEEAEPSTATSESQDGETAVPDPLSMLVEIVCSVDALSQLCYDSCAPPEEERGDMPVARGYDGSSIWFGSLQKGGHDYLFVYETGVSARGFCT